jgi:hypothetical protein
LLHSQQFYISPLAIVKKDDYSVDSLNNLSKQEVDIHIEMAVIGIISFESNEKWSIIPFKTKKIGEQNA